MVSPFVHAEAQDTFGWLDNPNRMIVAWSSIKFEDVMYSLRGGRKKSIQCLSGHKFALECNTFSGRTERQIVVSQYELLIFLSIASRRKRVGCVP